MATVHPEIDAKMAAWIAAQPLYFNATAPLTADGHINLSPRGLDTLRVLGPREVAYLDLVGNSNESAAHLAENGRITLMFCAFSGAPQILRLFGTGEVLRPDHPRFPALREQFPPGQKGIRQLVHIRVRRVQTSCGFGVPLLDYVGQREELPRWAEKKGEAGLADYQRRNNSRSIDGLPAPGLTDPPNDA